MVDTAFKPANEIRSTTPTFMIANATLSNFRRVLFDTAFLVFFRNSLIVAVASTIFTMVVAVFTGYAMSRWGEKKAVKLVSGALLASQMIPGVLLLVPLYMLVKSLHLLSSYGALILVYTSFMLPVCTFMLKGYFDAIPVKLEDAAEIDGCSLVGTIFRIVLPLSTPGILSTWVFAFINAWNEFMFGYVLINDEAHRTLTPGVMLFKGLYATDWGGLMAAAVLAILPVAAMFLYLQRFLIEGLSAGAVKG
jgi:ABC-type glycerol-3-phosphate transport system permease component